MKYKNTLYLLVVVFLVQACSTSQKITVRHIDDVVKPYEYSYIYALPMTIINIELGSVKKTIEKGTYAEYANKYLGIDDAYTDNKQLWSLNKAKIETHEETDPEQYYLVKCKGQGTLKNQLFELSEKGLAMQVENIPQGLSTENRNKTEAKNGKLSVQNFPISGNLVEVTDTLYKTLYQDSAFIKVPVYRNKVMPKNKEQKAKEAADLLVKLKQRELQLITGEDDFYPGEETLKYSIHEIRKMQDGLLKLFTGTSYESKHLVNYLCIPDSNISDTIILSRFDEDQGFLSTKQNKGKPVYCIIEKGNKTRPLEKLTNKNENKKEQWNKIFYRIPDKATVKIVFDGTVITGKEILVDQFGVIVEKKL